MSKQDKTITFEVERQLAVLQECESGWQRELNRVVWNGEPVKFDIRAWSENHRKMSRGITLTDEEGWVVFNNPNIVDLSSLVIRHERMITLKGLEAVAREVLSREKE